LILKDRAKGGGASSRELPQQKADNGSIQETKCLKGPEKDQYCCKRKSMIYKDFTHKSLFPKDLAAGVR